MACISHCNKEYVNFIEKYVSGVRKKKIPVRFIKLRLLLSMKISVHFIKLKLFLTMKQNFYITVHSIF